MERQEKATKNSRHEQDYFALGYQVERVPVLSPGERLNFVIEKLTELGLTLESS
jgi:predicted ATPase